MGKKADLRGKNDIKNIYTFFFLASFLILLLLYIFRYGIFNDEKKEGKVNYKIKVKKVNYEDSMAEEVFKHPNVEEVEGEVVEGEKLGSDYLMKVEKISYYDTSFTQEEIMNH